MFFGGFCYVCSEFGRDLSNCQCYVVRGQGIDFSNFTVYTTDEMLAFFFVLLPTTTLSQPPIQCGNTTTFCPAEGKCCFAKYSPTKYGCQLPIPQPNNVFFPPSPTASCCMPGPQLPASSTQPNCLVIGDSVSIGYVGVSTKNLSDIALLQHGPWDVMDGGAGSTLVGQTW